MHFTAIHFALSAGVFRPKPLVLTAKDANCRWFTVDEGATLGSRYLRVWREMTDAQVKRDPYNDDGNPPRCMFTLYCGQWTAGPWGLTAAGVQEGNLCHDGEMIEPYKANGPRPVCARGELGNWLCAKGQVYVQRIELIA